MSALSSRPVITERQWQEKVCEFATLRQWRWYHTHDSRRSNPGFPDLVLVRGRAIVFVELKSDRGRTTPDQLAWLNALREARKGNDNVIVSVWRPSDWPAVMEVLA